MILLSIILSVSITLINMWWASGQLDPLVFIIGMILSIFPPFGIISLIDLIRRYWKFGHLLHDFKEVYSSNPLNGDRVSLGCFIKYKCTKCAEETVTKEVYF